MNKLIKIEMERAFKNKMLIISVVIGLVIVGFNIWNEIIPARKTLDKLLEMGKYSGIQLPGLYMKWNMVFLPHICISKIEEYKEGIDVFALAYRNHTDDHYMAADR